MKTSEFVEKVEALPFVDEVVKTSFNNTLMVYRILDSDLMAVVETDKMHAVDTQYLGFTNLSDEEKSQLMPIIWKYISTPVDEREPEKRYMYKLPSDFDVRNVLTLSLSIEKYFFSRVEHEIYREGTLMYQKYFTDKEVEMMPADVINVLKACVKEEVD